jgi:hypothetical protein
MTPVDAASAWAVTAPSAQPVFPVATPDTSLPATFAWLTPPVSSSPGANPQHAPGLRAVPALRRLHGFLRRLEPQQDRGDLGALTEEIADWSADRARATRLFTDD